MHHKQTPGPFDRLEDGIHVERLNRAQINYFRFDTLLREGLSGFKREQERTRIRHDRDIASISLDFRLADWDGMIAIGHITFGIVKKLVFDKDHRVSGADTALEQALCIRGGGRRNND